MQKMTYREIKLSQKYANGKVWFGKIIKVKLQKWQVEIVEEGQKIKLWLGNKPVLAIINRIKDNFVTFRLI